MNPVAMSVPEFADRIGVSRSHAYRLVRSGEIPVLRFGHRVLVPVALLDRLIEALMSEAPQEQGDSAEGVISERVAEGVRSANAHRRHVRADAPVRAVQD